MNNDLKTRAEYEQEADELFAEISAVLRDKIGGMEGIDILAKIFAVGECYYKAGQLDAYQGNDQGTL